MDACFPIAVLRSVTFSAEHGHFRFGNLGTVVVDEGIAVLWVVAIQAVAVVAMVEDHVLVLDLELFAIESRIVHMAMALHTIVFPPHTLEIEAHHHTRRDFVQMRIVIFTKEENRFIRARIVLFRQVIRPWIRLRIAIFLVALGKHKRSDQAYAKPRQGNAYYVSRLHNQGRV